MLTFFGLPPVLRFFLTLGILIVFTAIGVWLGRYIAKTRTEKEEPGKLGVGSILGLLALILTSIFEMASSRLAQRKQLVLEEANAITNVYLMAKLLPEPESNKIKRLIKEYLTTRLDLETENIEEKIKRAEGIHPLLWTQVKNLMTTNLDSDFRGAFIGSVTQLINLHQNRKTVAIHYRIQGALWWTLSIISLLSIMALGFQAGVTGFRKLWALPLVAIALTLVVNIVADLDHPKKSLIKASDLPLQDTEALILRDESAVAE